MNCWKSKDANTRILFLSDSSSSYDGLCSVLHKCVKINYEFGDEVAVGDLHVRIIIDV